MLILCVTATPSLIAKHAAMCGESGIKNQKKSSPSRRIQL